MIVRILLLSFFCLVLAGCAGLASQSTTDSTASDQLPTSATVGDNDIIAIAVPAQKCCQRQTLPQFLGLDQLGAGIGGIFQRVFSRLQTSLGLEGKFPGLQPQEPLKNITDPANLSEDSPPAVQAAAKIKAEQDQAKQKVQALRYLATIGCGGCYPEVEDALLAALDDCTESVRYEAVKALRGKRGNSCCFCNQNGCCSAKVQKKLNEIVNKVDQSGNYVERSERVRRMARVVLNGCPPALESSEIPEEGPSLSPQEELATRTEIQAVSKIFDNQVQPASFISDDTTDSDFCLASVNGYRLMASELNLKSGRLSREKLQHRIYEIVAQQQFVREDRRFNQWDESLKPALVHWMKQRGFLRSASENELATYYQNNQNEFALPASVRWEAVSVSFTDLSQRNQLRNQLELLRESLNSNRPVATVEVNGAVVQTFEWTQPSEIKDPNLRNAIFETAIGKASGIVENRNQMMLVRVLEKRKSEVQSFASVRDAIQEKLEAFRIRDAMGSLYDNVKSNYQIWTIYDQSNPKQTANQKSTISSNQVREFSRLEDSGVNANDTGKRKSPVLIRKLSTH